MHGVNWVGFEWDHCHSPIYPSRLSLIGLSKMAVIFVTIADFGAQWYRARRRWWALWICSKGGNTVVNLRQKVVANL